MTLPAILYSNPPSLSRQTDDDSVEDTSEVSSETTEESRGLAVGAEAVEGVTDLGVIDLFAIGRGCEAVVETEDGTDEASGFSPAERGFSKQAPSEQE